MPTSVQNLLDISYIKSLCRIAGISDALQTETGVNFVFTETANPEAVIKLISEYEKDMRFVSGAKSKIIYKCKDNIIGNVKIILQKLVNSIQDAQ